MKYVALGSLTELNRPITYGVVQPGDDPGDGVPLVRAGDVENGRVAIDVLRTVSQEISRGFSRTVLRGGELLVSLVGNPGEVAVAPASLAGANLSRQVAMVALGAAADAGYVKYYLMSEVGRAHLFMRTGGAVQQVINLADLKTVPIALPDLAAQRQIASDLESYDDLIDNNRRRIQLLEDSVRLLFDEWFVRCKFPASPLVGGEAQLLKLSDLCDDLRQLVLPEELDPTTPYIGLEHMPRRSITLSDWDAASDVSSSKLCYSAGDVVFGKIRPYFHKVGLALTDGVCSSDAIVMRAKAPQWRALLLALVSSDEFIAATSQAMKEGSKMPRADWKQMKAYQISVPSQRVLEAFNAVVDPILEQVRTLALQARALRTARDLLLPRLMSGELTG